MKTTRTATLALGLIAATVLPGVIEAQIIKNEVLNSPLTSYFIWKRVSYTINSVVQVNDADPSRIQVTVVPNFGGQFVVAIPAFVLAPGTIDTVGHVAPATGELMARMCKEFQFNLSRFKPLGLYQFRSWYNGTVNADGTSQVKLTFANPQLLDDLGGLVDVLITDSASYFAEFNMTRPDRIQKYKLLRTPVTIEGITLQPMPINRVREFFDFSLSGVPFKAHEAVRDPSDGARILHARSYWSR